VGNHKNLGGGIVEMPEDRTSAVQELGKGFTTYFFVDKLEDVCLNFLLLFFFFFFFCVLLRACADASD
jgi:hypothetical protein